MLPSAEQAAFEIGYALRSLLPGICPCFDSSDAGGIPSGSRWLSATGATPPDRRPPEFRTPAGVPSDALQPAMLASLQDADSLAIHRPVVSLVPRSTTGYKMESLRDDHASSFSLSK